MIPSTGTAPRQPRLVSRLAATLATVGLVLSGIAMGTLPAQAAPAESLSVTGLQANGRVDPLGIGGDDPVLSWKSESSGRSVSQSAYEVRVASSADALPSADVWSSGRVASDDQLNVVYGGPGLTSQTRYYWQVRNWSNHDTQSDWSAPAWFETGLLSTAEWKADWIGGVDPSAKWRDYTVTANFSIDNLVMGLTAHAKDINNAYMFQVSVASGAPHFRPHKKTNGGWALLEDKDISSVISTDELLTGSHTLAVTFQGSTIISTLDGTEIDRRTDDSLTEGYVGFRQSVATEGNEASTIHWIKVTSPTDGVLLDTDFSDGANPFTGGTVTDAGLKLVAPDEVIYRSHTSKPLLRKDFSVDKTVTSARVYAAARGVYELSLNGKKVGDQQLAPGWTDYNKRIDYQTYDVTDLVKDGDNALGAMLADGWYSGTVASFGSGLWGKADSLIAQLRVDYSDGTHDWINTDSSWKTADGPYVQTDLIMGETYDARLNPTGWQKADYSTADWSKVGVADDDATSLLEPQSDEPVRVTEKRTPISVTESAPNTWIYDMGQNMVGVAKMELTGAAGSTATIRYGEMLNPDGTLYTANLRGAKATDYYTFAADGTATYTPNFTFHGFRYLEITGVDTPPTADQVTGLVWGSDLKSTGTLSTSSDMLNQLQSNISWGQRGNFLSIPTDTPARDERLGWTGDINVFSPTASYNQDTLAFLGKWLVDLKDAQGSDGNLPGTAPQAAGCCGGGTGWSDAGITVPFALFNAYGDTKVVRDNYDMMTKFMNFVETSTGASLIRTSGPYADWLNLDDPTDGSLLGTAYYAYISGLMSQMSAAIGKTDDAAHYADLADRVKAAFADRFVSADGTVSGDSQTGYAMSIGMGLVPANVLTKTADKYLATLERRDYHLSTGFLGTPWLLPALTATGHQDVAYRLLNTETYPSWGYEVASGATTMWERWDSLKPDGTFGDVSMNSFNHYAYGAVGEWMYQNIGGIAMTSPGYKTFDIAPSIGGGLTHGEGTLDSVYGTITSDWSTTQTGTTLKTTVPVNTTATVKIPGTTRYDITEGGKALNSVDGVTVVSEKDGVVTLSVGSGEYAFSSDPANSGIDVKLTAGGQVLPGETVTGTVTVTNPGPAKMTAFAGVLSTSPAIDLKPAVVTADSVAPGTSKDLPFTVTIPAEAVPGDVTVSATITALVGGDLRQFTVTSPLATVLPAIAIDPITAKPSSADQPEVATVDATLTNVSKTAISGRLVIDAPDGWPTPLPSRVVRVEAGAAADAQVVVSVPLTITAGPQNLKARFVADGDRVLARASTSFDVALATPPAEFTDHVDLGEATSEGAHNLKSSGQGGTTVEAGLTRRYSGIHQDAWFSFDMKVTPNKPFIIRGIETFDQQQIKSYDILVNGTVVNQRLYHRTETGPGLATYQVLVPDDGTLTSSGTVTITMRYNGLGTHDPSVADVWTMPAPGDTIAPAVVLDVSKAGLNGWYLGGAKASLQASDARSGVASIEYRVGGGDWIEYDGAIALDEGTTSFSYRATDEAGNTSAAQTEKLRVDATAPTQWGWLSSKNAVVSFTQDGGSGVDHASYSLDGDLWYDSVTALMAASSAPKQVQLRAVDVAGNTSDVMTLDPAEEAPMLTIAPGQKALIESSSFTPGASVRVELHSDPVNVLGTVVADAGGVVSLTADIPAGLPAGDHSLVFVVTEPDGGANPGGGDGSTGGGSTGGGSSVTIPAQVIADTGSDVVPWAVGGVLLLLAGCVFLIARRRRVVVE